MFRTYARTLFNDILKKNIIVTIFKKIVTFYFNIWQKEPKAIKFGQIIPMNNLEKKKALFFQSVTGDKIDCR